MSREEKKPYNPYHLAGGYAAPTLPDKKTIAVFKCYCNHTDFMGGSISISIDTVMRETGYCHRAGCYADAVLISLGRITKKSRGIGGQRGGRQSSITRVYCTEAELKAAGANDENYYGRGGTHGLFKVQTPPIQSAKRVHSKRKQDGFKVQRVALEPLKSEPFLPQPIKAEPLKAGANQSQPQETFTSSTQGKKGQPTPTPEAAGNTMPAGIKNQLRGSARPAPPSPDHLSPETAAKMLAVGFPQEVVTRITKMIDWSTALNNTSNVISSYETLALKPNAFASKMFDMWMPKRILSGYGDDCYDQGYEESIMKENAKPREQRVAEAAMSWWGMLEDERRHKLVEFPETYKSFLQAAKDRKEEIVTAYLADLEDRRRAEHERVMKLDREAKLRKAGFAAKVAQVGKSKVLVAVAAGIPDEGSSVDDI